MVTKHRRSKKQKSKHVRITVHGNRAKVRGGSKTYISRLCRVRDPSCYHDPQYRKGAWDGYIRLYRQSDGTIPAPLVPYLESQLRSDQYRVTITHTEESDPDEFGYIDKWYLSDKQPLWQHQLEGIRAALRSRIGTLKVVTAGGKTEMAVTISKALVSHEHFPVIIVTTPRNKGAVSQWKQRFARYYDGTYEVGTLGGGSFRPDQITLCTPQSLESAIAARGSTAKSKAVLSLLARAKAVIVDECHNARSNRHQLIRDHLKSCQFWIGLSGTPRTKNPAENLRIESMCGPIVYTATYRELVARGLISRVTVYRVTDASILGPRIKKHPDDTPGEAYRKAYNAGIVSNVPYNSAIARIAKVCKRLGKTSLITARRIPQINLISTALDSVGCRHFKLDGRDHGSTRDAVKDAMMSDTTSVLLGSTIFDEGEDVSTIKATILAGGEKAVVSALQRPGRSMRGPGEAWVWDFSHQHNPFLKKHAEERLRVYEEEGYDIVNVSNLDAFLRKLIADAKPKRSKPTRKDPRTPRASKQKRSRVLRRRERVVRGSVSVRV